MKIYSGNLLKGICGNETSLRDRYGDWLYVGDIVLLYTIDEFGLSNEMYLSCIVCDKYKTYPDGGIEVINKNPAYFAEGIENVDFMKENSKWIVEKIKSFEDVIDGEKWTDGYEFNFKDR